MPYFNDLNLLGEEENPSHVQISGSSGTTDTSGNPGGGGGQSAQKPLNTGSGFQNLDSYLKNNDAQSFGGQVLGKVGSGIDQAQQNQTQASNQFKTQVSDQNKTPGREQVSQALANPSSSNPSEFQSWMNQSYQGPRSLSENQSDWNKYWSGTQQANTQAQLLGSEPGRFTLLDSFFGKPSYSFGQKSLDNLLFQQSGLGGQTKGLQDQAAQLKAQGTESEKKLQDYASSTAGNVADSAKAVQDQYNQTVQGAQNAVQSTTDQQNAARVAQQKDLLAHLNPQNLTPDEMNALGIGQGTSLYNITDLTPYYQAGTNLTNEQAATPEERARLDALSQLGGVPQSYLGAAQDALPAYTFDTNRLNSDIQTQAAPFQKDFQSFTGAINGDVAKNLPKDALTQDPQQLLDSLRQERATYAAAPAPTLHRASGSSYKNAQLEMRDKQINALNELIYKYGVNNRIGSLPQSASKPAPASKGPK